MPKQVVPLSDVKIKKMKEGTLRDGNGLYLIVSSVGTKLWRFDYRYDGKRLTLSLGSYPEVSLETARELRTKFRSQVAQGIDPGAVKKIVRTVKTDIENSFEVVTREWHAKFKHTWGEKHSFHKLQRLESNVFPWVGEPSKLITNGSCCRTASPRRILTLFSLTNARFIES